jgi:hypothetical protein
MGLWDHTAGHYDRVYRALSCRLFSTTVWGEGSTGHVGGSKTGAARVGGLQDPGTIPTPNKRETPTGFIVPSSQAMPVLRGWSVIVRDL